MPDLNFQVEVAEPVPFTAAPLLAFKLRITAAEEARAIQAVALRCQIRIEPAKRSYDASEGSGLLDLFGEPRRWNQTLRSLLWTHASLVVPPFTGSTLVDLPVPCTFDFNVATTKYFHALEGGEVPVCLLFSGTIFFEADDGLLQVAQIPWDKEATFRLPVRVWRDMMDLYYPNTAWLYLRRDVFDRLHRHKSRLGLPTWEETLEGLIPPDDPEGPP